MGQFTLKFDTEGTQSGGAQSYPRTLRQIFNRSRPVLLVHGHRNGRHVGGEGVHRRDSLYGRHEGLPHGHNLAHGRVRHRGRRTYDLGCRHLGWCPRLPAGVRLRGLRVDDGDGRHGDNRCGLHA